MNSAIRLGTQAFDETDPVQLWPSDSLETVDMVIRSIYRQVLGNAHVMESERAAVAEAESLLRNRTITVREFIRRLAKSELYRTRFFEPCSRNRFIELNFKHLLGRAPDGYSEIATHSNLLESEGFDAEIDSYLGSNEYNEVFGEHRVPYYRGHRSPTGKKVAGFANLFKLLRGTAGHDHHQAQPQARLTQSIMADYVVAIAPVSNGPTPQKSQPQPVSPSPYPYQAKTDSLHQAEQLRYQGYEPFRQTSAIELWPGASAEDIDMVIRSVYRHVMGNAHIMESERLTVPESQLKKGTLSVREFVRQVAKSELYRSRFMDNCYRYRAIELNFKHLLGRAPQTFEEMKAHSAILDTAGYAADIDSYIDSEEYHNAFGENIVPYYRGHRTEAGQTMLEFTNMLQLLKSASSSDKDLTNNAPRLSRAIIRNASNGVEKVRDVQDILAEVFRPRTSAPVTPTPQAEVSTLQTQVDEQDALIAKLRKQLAELRPLAGIGTSVIQKGQRPLTDSRVSPMGQTEEKATLIKRLQGELMEARALATIGEARLNKWRNRSFR
ncbi:MAG: phycobilisome rod-core linker polypeptide [Cyanobacteria bacterium P01_A01_bin.137]